MNHPTREEWMSYLYDELTGEEHADLAAHLAVCPECNANVRSWRGLKHDLDAWQLPARTTRKSWNRPIVRWAAAAAIILIAGFGIGRLSASRAANVEQVRAALEPSLRKELRQELSQLLRQQLDQSSTTTLAAAGTQTRDMLGDFVRAYEQNRADDNRAVYAALARLDSERMADSTALKRDLDTVAVYSEAGLRQTQRQLVSLANNTGSSGNPSDLPPN